MVQERLAVLHEPQAAQAETAMSKKGTLGIQGSVRRSKRSKSGWSIVPFSKSARGKVTRSRLDKSAFDHTIRASRLVAGGSKKEKPLGKRFIYYKGASLSKSGGKLPRLSLKKSSYGKSLRGVKVGNFDVGVLLRLWSPPPPLDAPPVSLDGKIVDVLDARLRAARDDVAYNAEFSHAKIEVLTEAYIDAKIQGDEVRATAIREEILKLQAQLDPLDKSYWQNIKQTIKREVINPIGQHINNLRDSQPNPMDALTAPFLSMYHQVADPIKARLDEISAAEREKKWGRFQTEEGRTLVAQWLRLKRVLGIN